MLTGLTAEANPALLRSISRSGEVKDESRDPRVGETKMEVTVFCKKENT